MPPSDRQLQDMGLTDIDNNDESPTYSDWARKTTLHEAIIASDQPNKPRCDLLWATARDSVTNSTTCNMCLNIARITFYSSTFAERRQQFG